jgi:uncharacterized membrane protein YsdA (DUF1294 family)
MSYSQSRHPLWLLVGFWICVAISVAVVIRRMLALTAGSNGGTGPFPEINATFSAHAALTMAHIVPAVAFVLLTPFVLFYSGRAPLLHRLFFALGAITGLTAYAMSRYSIGGWIERSAVLVFDTWFLISLSVAWRSYMGRQIANQRRWTTRAVGILLGIATTRPVMGAFFATSALTHLAPRQFFGIAFWIGFSINVLIIELWLHSRRRAQLQQSSFRVLQQSAR